MENINSEQEQTSIKSYKGYENRYVIIQDSTEFQTYQKKKIKKAWLNEKGKLCLKSFIFLGQDKSDETKYNYTDVIGKDAKKKEDYENNSFPSESYEDLFKNNLVFVGFLDNDKVVDEIRVKQAGF